MDLESKLKEVESTVVDHEGCQTKISELERDLQEALRQRNELQAQTTRAREERGESRTSHQLLAGQRDRIQAELEAAKSENEYLHQQLEASKTGYAKLETLRDEQRKESDVSMAQLQQQHREKQGKSDATLAQLKGQHIDAVMNLEDKHAAELKSMRGKHNDSLHQLRQDHDTELASKQAELDSTVAVHEQNLARSRKRHEDEASDLRERYESELKSLHEKLRETKNEVSRLKQKTFTDTTKLDDEHAAQLNIEREKLETLNMSILRLQTEHHNNLNELQENHTTDLKSQLGNQKEVLEANHAINLKSKLDKQKEALESNHAADLQSQLDKQKEALEANHAADLNSKHDKQKEAWEGAVARSNQQHLEDVSRLNSAHSEKLKSIGAEHAGSISQLQQNHAAELKTKMNEREHLERQHRDAIDALKEEHAAELESKVDQTAERLQQQVDSHALELRSARKLLSVYVECINGFPIDDRLCKDLIDSYPRLAMHQGVEFEFESGLPRILFVPDVAPFSPLAHAVSLWIAAQADRPSFGNTQALFNARVINADMAAVYPWILAAVGANLDRMPTWGSDLLAYKRVLTVLQGIVYLNMLAQRLQISLDDVRRLCNRAGGYLTGESTIGSKPLVQTVFRRVAASLDGQPLASWIDDGPVSDSDESRRLDGSNSAVGANRCLIANTTGGIIVLIDEISVNETLYVFTENDVDEIVLDREGMIQVNLVDCLVANCVEHQLLLGIGPAVIAFTEVFSLDKF